MTAIDIEIENPCSTLIPVDPDFLRNHEELGDLDCGKRRFDTDDRACRENLRMVFSPGWPE